MGFLDKIKQQATDVATTVVEKTTDTAKTGQLQMQLRSLKGEEKEALADLGAAMIALGETPDLAGRPDGQGARASRPDRGQGAGDRRRARRPRVRAADASSETVESEAEEVADTPPAAARRSRRPTTRPAG